MHTEHSFEIIWSAEAEVPFVGLWCHNCSKYLEVREYPADSLVFYITSPLSAATHTEVAANMERAKTYQQEVARIMQEDLPGETICTYAPHATLPLELDDSDPASRKAAIEFDLEVLRHCAGLVVCGSTISAGMQEEIDFAKENKIAIWRYNGNSIFAF